MSSEASPLTSSDNKNILLVYCNHCNSRILSPQSATLLCEDHQLPTPAQPKEAPMAVSEQISKWWVVDDIFTFDNIGFSHTVDTTKYLTCADCEFGPVGYHDINTKKSFIALDRVLHKETS